MVTDYTKLNHYVKRPVHPFPSVQDIVQSIPTGSQLFAEMDAIHGYFQLSVEEESSKITTFLLPSGRYRCLHAPMGLSSSSDEWCRQSDRAIQGLTFTKKIVDDILIWASTLPELVARINIVGERLRNMNIILSTKKIQIGSELPFAVLIISAKGISPDPERTRALFDFPVPKGITGVRSFLGLANQLKLNQRTTPAPSSYMGPPMGHVGVDLFDFSAKKFLICVD